VAPLLAQACGHSRLDPVLGPVEREQAGRLAAGSADAILARGRCNGRGEKIPHLAGFHTVTWRPVISVRAVEAAAVRPLRQSVLRPHQRAEDLVWAGDLAPTTLHVAAFDGEAMVAVATIAEEPYPRSPAPGDWRVRGMATTPQARGSGAGGALLDACLDHARAHGGRRAWCNARTPARPFYERWGFTAEGDEFELPQIGPHFLMSLDLASS